MKSSGGIYSWRYKAMLDIEKQVQSSRALIWNNKLEANRRRYKLLCNFILIISIIVTIFFLLAVLVTL
jgi:t-SNARE complex subunit (syntaxin)